MRSSIFSLLAVLVGCGSMASVRGTLSLPEIRDILPVAGERAKVIPEEYEGTGVYYSIYLPENWVPEGRYPVIVEYTGNYWPPAGSTGQVKDANLGYAVAKRLGAIWLVMPYVRGGESIVTWWGSESETVEYALTNIRRVCLSYGGNPSEVFVCGFSRGAIGVNYLGLHDEEVADVWLGFFSHDHYDGEKEWGGNLWGSPLEVYRLHARERVRRMRGRAALVSSNSNGKVGVTRVQSFIDESGYSAFGEFTFLAPAINDIVSGIPNEEVPHPHTDKWLLYPSEEADRVFEWFADTIAKKPGTFSISGKVKDENGRPMKHVLVTSGRTHFAITDDRGNYVMEGLRLGRRVVEISSEGVRLGKESRRTVELYSDMEGVDFGVPNSE